MFAAVSRRRRSLDCLVLAVVELVIVVQRQSGAVDSQVSAVSEPNSDTKTPLLHVSTDITSRFSLSELVRQE